METSFRNCTYIPTIIKYRLAWKEHEIQLFQKLLKKLTSNGNGLLENNLIIKKVHKWKSGTSSICGNHKYIKR